jgi:hypothetical protein
VREVFISVPSFVLEANVNASDMGFGSDDDSRHRQDIKVVKLAGMDGEGERSIFISVEANALKHLLAWPD